VEEFEKAGMMIYRIQPEDRAKWEEPLKGIEEVWVQDMEKKGLPAKRFLRNLKGFARKWSNNTPIFPTFI